MSELVQPTTRIINFDEKENNEHTQLIEKELHEQKREEARIGEEKYKWAMTRYYNSKLSHKSTIPRDLVLRKTRATGINKEKIATKWEGPYVVSEEVRPGSYILTSDNGK